jgi:secreted Zn-dependent insulinase-like peptidase
MKSNIDRYKSDLQKLIDFGHELHHAIQYECFPEKVIEALKEKKLPAKEQKLMIEKLPGFSEKYQTWYSESLTIIKTIMPDQLINFISYYKKPKNRKELAYGNYVIEDYLQGLRVLKSFGEEKVGPSAAIPQF